MSKAEEIAAWLQAIAMHEADTAAEMVSEGEDQDVVEAAREEAKRYGEAAAELRRLAAENARLREALEQAALVFEQYKELHLGKAPADLVKAARNQEHAKRARAALA